jgi:hypothetical protein
MEGGQVSKIDGDDSGQKRRRIKTILDPEGRLLRRWNMIFAVSCVIAVLVDPLFFYVFLINEDKKCLLLDKRLKIVAITLRSVTDFIYALNIILQFICPYIDEECRKLGRIKVVTDPRQIAKHYFFSRYFVIDLLATLPIPQVIKGLRHFSFLCMLMNCFVFVNVISSLTARRIIIIIIQIILIDYVLSRLYFQLFFQK